MSRTLASTLVLVGCMGAASAQPPKAVFVVNGVIVRQGQSWTDEQIEAWVFGDNASMARRRIESRLADQIQDLDRACTLTDAQKEKLHLAGRGDIKRFFDRFDAFKRKAQRMQQDEQKMQRIFQEIPPLQATLHGGLFHEDSLLVKSLPTTLTAEQFARYDAMARERRLSRHRESVLKAVGMLKLGFENAVARLGRDIVLREEQRQALITLMTQETRPSRRPGPYDYHVLLLQLGRLPEEKFKRLFDDDQWQIINGMLAGFQRLEPMLRREGLLPAEGDGE
jgi:hypothetical protein